MASWHETIGSSRGKRTPGLGYFLRKEKCPQKGKILPRTPLELVLQSYLPSPFSMFSPKVPGEGQGPDQQTYLLSAVPTADGSMPLGQRDVSRWSRPVEGVGAGTDWTSPV